MPCSRLAYTNKSSPAPATLPRPLKDSGFGNMTSLANRTGLVLDKDFNVTSKLRLPAWTSDPKLALSTDSGTKRNVFWLGSDRRPHHIYITTQGWDFQDTNVGIDEWPVADADSDLALAYERGTDNVRLYYVVGGRLNELRHDKVSSGNGYEWKVAAALPITSAGDTSTTTGGGGGGTTTNDTNNGGSSTGQETSDSQSGSDAGLSTGAKVGLGVGIALGVVAVGAACLSIWYVRRLKKTQAAAARAQADEDDEEKRRRYEQVQQEQQQQYNPYQYQQVQQQHGGPPYPHSNGTSQFGSEMGSPETTYHYGGYIPDKKAPLASASPVPQEMNANPAVYELPEQRRATEMDGGSDVMSPQSTHR